MPSKEAAHKAWNTRLQSIPEPLLDEGLVERIVTEFAEPWADYHGELPDYDHPLRPVFESGVQYTVELLAKQLNVDDWTPCDGTEEFDGDLGGTLLNIVSETWPKDEHGDWIDLRDAETRAALSIPRLEVGRVTVDEALRLADEAADHAGAGSLTLDNASAQRLMDYGLLHHTDEGWVVSKDIWNASAPDGLPLVERMREAIAERDKVIGVFADALDMADGIIATACGTDTPKSWGQAFAKCAKARAALTELEEKSDG